MVSTIYLTLATPAKRWIQLLSSLRVDRMNGITMPFYCFGTDYHVTCNFHHKTPFYRVGTILFSCCSLSERDPSSFKKFNSTVKP